MALSKQYLTADSMPDYVFNKIFWQGNIVFMGTSYEGAAVWAGSRLLPLMDGSTTQSLLLTLGPVAGFSL